MSLANQFSSPQVAARQGVAFHLAPGWGCLEVAGEDRIRFLHNQTTANFQGSHPGQSSDTIFVTATARMLDLATAYLLPDRVWLLVSPQRRHRLLNWMDRFIFPADQVTICDLTPNLGVVRLLGPDSSALVAALGGEPTHPSDHHWQTTIGGIELHLGADSGLACPGYTLVVPGAELASLTEALASQGAARLQAQDWEQLRIEQGRPLADAEVTEEYNPLEARLYHALHFNQGCYIGQETITRLNTYQGVKQRLWGVCSSALIVPGAKVWQAEVPVGVVTSVAPDGRQGLAYVRTRAGGAGLEVLIDQVPATLVDRPFLGLPQTT